MSITSHIMKMSCKSTSALVPSHTAAIMMLMLGKVLLSGLWVCPECHSFVSFHTSSCLTLLFHRYIVFHHFRCDPALSVFASNCQGDCHAWTAALCDLGDPDPWFLHWALLLLTPIIWPLVILSCLLFCFLLGALFVMTQKMSSCINSHRWLQSHFLVFCFVWLVCFCFWALFWVFGFPAMIAYWTAYRSITSIFVAIDYRQPCTIISIHLLLGPCLSSFFEIFCIKVAEAQRFGFNEDLWLMATGRATREALLSEAGFEKLFRTQNWVRRSKLFCRWFCFLLGQAGCISVAAWTQLEGCWR